MIALYAHAETPPHGDLAVEAGVIRMHDGLRLHYRLLGDIAALRLPRATATLRTDELWRATCFEVFVRTRVERAYREYNFAPSTQWAAYHFVDYREGMTEIVEAAPTISVGISSNSLDLVATMSLPRRISVAELTLGLSAVVEEKDGTKSYWALAHPLEKPDFHHDDCFALDLEAGDAP